MRKSIRTKVWRAMFSVALAAAFGVSFSATAQSKRISASDYRGSSYGTGPHAISGAFGFYSPGAALIIDTSKPANQQNVSPAASGFFGIGGDYEYMVANDFTIGGLFRYYSTSDSTTNTSEQRVAGWHLGGMAKAYLNTENFAPYVGAGLGMINLSVKTSTGGSSVDLESTSLGFTMALGILYKINDQFGLGIENLRGWALGEKLQGMPINDFMFKGKFTL